MLRRLPPLLGIIGINAVPAAGVFAAGWSAGDAMLLYLLENVSLVLFAALRVRLRLPADERKSIVSTFLIVGLGFSAVSAAFVGFFVFAILKLPVHGDEVLHAFAIVAAIQLVLFLFGRRPLTLPAGEKLLEQTLGRVFLLALCVFAGVFLAAFVERWFVVPFMVLKTIVDVGTQLEGVRASRVTALSSDASR